MKILILFMIFIAFVALSFSCGSNWTITGNNLIVTPLEHDSLVPAGSYVLTPLDSI